jgi:hypothetical protein
VNFISNIRSNLRLFLSALLLRRIDNQQFHADIWQGVLVVVLAALSYSFSQYVISDGPVRIADWALPGLITWLGAIFLVVIAAITVIFAFRQAAVIFVGVMLCIAFSTLIFTGVWLAGIREYWVLPYVQIAITPVMVLLFVFSALRGRFLASALRAVGFVAAFVGFLSLATDHVSFPYIFESIELSDDAAEIERPRIATEDLYYAQAKLVNAQIESLAEQTPGKTDFFGLIVGGTAHQSVFLSEAEHVRRIMEDQYAMKGRVVTLVNSNTRPTDYPMATKHNLITALDALASKMDMDEDIAFLYLTSHGGKDTFSLSFWEAGIRSLTASEFAAMLEASGIRNAVIVISACYSGSFIDDLANDNRLILTAASENNSSFGCSDQNEWTWWGRAYFDEALRSEPDFRKAFDIAKDLVTTWEGDAGYDASLPQISEGEKINLLLNATFDSKYPWKVTPTVNLGFLNRFEAILSQALGH